MLLWQCYVLMIHVQACIVHKTNDTLASHLCLHDSKHAAVVGDRMLLQDYITTAAGLLWTSSIY